MKNLFSEFKTSTAQDWKNQIIKDLKGEAYEQLIWPNENGFKLKPFYNREDLNYTAEAVFNHCDWEIVAKAYGKSDSDKNTSLLNALKTGASAVSVEDVTDYAAVLKNIELNYIQSSFLLKDSSVGDLITHLKKTYSLSDLSISLFHEAMHSEKDMLNWYNSVKDLHEFRSIKTTSINTLPYHQLNCDAQYELAVLFSELVEHLEFQRKNNIPFVSQPVIKTGVNSDFFVQIAKLRAIRKLWLLIKAEYTIPFDIYIIAETSLTNKSLSDNYNNLLRSTIESMAAVLGGCNELVVNRFDELLPNEAPLSKRMSLNQQLILKHESYFDKVADVACGSYFIEHLTDAIANSALNTFKRFEEQGGYFNCLSQKIFQQEIQKQVELKQKQINEAQSISIGVNKFKNPKESLKLSDSQLFELKNLSINNPVLQYELIHLLNK